MNFFLRFSDLKKVTIQFAHNFDKTKAEYVGSLYRKHLAFGWVQQSSVKTKPEARSFRYNVPKASLLSAGVGEIKPKLEASATLCV